MGLRVSTPQLVGAVQCSWEYLARLQEFVIAQAQSSLSCAQGPQSLTGGAWPLMAAPYICHLSFCVCVCVGAFVHACVSTRVSVCVIQARVCVCAQGRVRVFMHAWAHVCVCVIQACVHVCVYIRMYLPRYLRNFLESFLYMWQDLWKGTFLTNFEVSR